MTAQIEAFSRNRCEKYSTQAEFRMDNTSLKCFRNLELFWTCSYRFLWIMSDVLTHRFDVVNGFYYSRSTRVLCIRNCAQCLKFSDNKANTARWGMIYIHSISSECSLCSYNETVSPKIKLNNQSSLNNRSFFHFLVKNIITASNVLLF